MAKYLYFILYLAFSLETYKIEVENLYNSFQIRIEQMINDKRKLIELTKGI